MSARVEYLFALSISVADVFARGQGWRSSGRAAWQKRDGTTVYFLAPLAQLEIVSAGEIVHVIGTIEPEAILTLSARRRLRYVTHLPVLAEAWLAAFPLHGPQSRYRAASWSRTSTAKPLPYCCVAYRD
jgi:hypothetical protein